MRQCAIKRIPTATLHLDTFFPVSRGGRKWWMHPMFFTRYVMTADGDWPEKWQAMGIDHTWLPPAVRHDAAHFGKPRPEYECDVALVGSDGRGYHEETWPYRRELVEQLWAMCKRNGWSFKNPGGSDPKIDRGEDMNAFYASAKVTVGDSLCVKREFANYWSDRVPEATGRGGLLIMPWIHAVQKLYENWLPYYKWGDWGNLEEQIRIYLGDEERRKKVQEVTQSITADDHTYVNRVQTILDKVGI